MSRVLNSNTNCHKESTVKNLAKASLAISFMMSSPSAFAYEAWACGETIWGGVRNSVTFQVDRCDTPDGGAEDAAIEFAAQSWNSIFGVLDRFSFANGDNNCVITTANGRYEIGLVPNNDPLLDGNIGVSSKWLDDSDCGRVTGVSVAVRQTLPLGVVTELDARLTARGTLIHEFGHVLGSSTRFPTGPQDPFVFHENDVISIMNVGAKAKVGRRSGATSNSYGGRSQTVLPDDVLFASRFHPSSNAGRIDAIVSPWSFSAGQQNLNYSGTNRLVCPGDTTDVKFSYGNIGKLAITDANRVSLDVYLSSNDYISTGDRKVQGGSFTAARGGFGTTTWSFVVPSLSAGTYFVGVIADAEQAHAEDDNYNNATETGLRLTIRSGC